MHARAPTRVLGSSVERIWPQSLPILDGAQPCNFWSIFTLTTAPHPKLPDMDLAKAQAASPYARSKPKVASAPVAEAGAADLAIAGFGIGLEQLDGRLSGEPLSSAHRVELDELGIRSQHGRPIACLGGCT
jgi:hypothetical protein